MVFESLKIGIIVGLEREKILIPKNSNIIVKKGYGQKANIIARKMIKKNIDVLISFGLAKSTDPNINNSAIIIPQMTFDEKGKGLFTSKELNRYFKKKIPYKIFSKNILTVSKVLNNKKFLIGENIGGVDMESSHIHKVAKQNKVKFSCIRIIFDDESNPIPDFIIETLDKEGNPKLIELMKKIILKPSRIRRLVNLSKHYYRSIKVVKKISKIVFSNN
jgi:hypothetical protein